MAKRLKKAHRSSPAVITVRRIGTGGTAGTGAPPSPQPRRKSAALQKAKDGVMSARKAAARAGQVVRSEPARVAVGVLGGNVLGKVSGDMIHKSAVKAPSGYAAKNEAAANLIGGAAAGVVAVGSAMLSKGMAGRYATQVAAHAASHLLGAANAIDRAKKEPIPAGTAGADDPFVEGGEGDAGAPPRQSVRQDRRAGRRERRQKIVNRAAAAMRQEDPQGAGTEGPELEEYIGEVLDDAVEGLGDEGSDETGLLPLNLIAAASNPETVKALSQLLKLGADQGAQALRDRKAEAPVTAAVLALEGVDDVGASEYRQKMRDLRREERQLKKEDRKERRKQRKAARAKRRETRQEIRLEKKQEKVEALRGKDQRPIIVQPGARRAPDQRPIVILQQERAAEPEYEPETEEQVIYLATDEDVENYG